MNRLGIVTALPIEARQISRAVPSVELPLHVADHALLAVSGMGADKAARAAERLASRDVAVLVSVGFAGALDPSLRPGAVLLPETIVAADGRRFPVDETLHRQLMTLLCRDTPVTVSPLLEVTEPVSQTVQKAALRARFGAVAIDMESAAVARVARMHRLPFLVLRVVLDDARTALPMHLLATVNALGKLHLGASTLALLTHPMETLTAARLLRALSRARPALRRSAQALLTATGKSRPAPVARQV